MIIKANSSIGITAKKYHLIRKVSHLAPAIVLFYFTPLFSSNKYQITHTIANFISIINHLYIIFVTALIVDAFIKVFEDLYNTKTISQRMPIKSYVQVIRIVIFIFTAIFVISTLIDKSPWNLITGFGVATSVILLIFKDTILGFIASISLASYDMIRIGDWIELPQYGADGDVIEISLSTVKVRNFDKTISTIPTYSLMTSGVKNWRGMSESGGRRIKRSIFIDMKSVKFCNQELLDKLSKVDCIKDYISQKTAEIKEDSEKNSLSPSEEKVSINKRQLTNLGIFRSYLNMYLKQNNNIHKAGFTFLIRQLQPTDRGIPLELYVFTNTTDWVKYEEIQADIFDHILAALTEFELEAFQGMSSYDLKVKVTGDKK